MRKNFKKIYLNEHLKNLGVKNSLSQVFFCISIIHFILNSNVYGAKKAEYIFTTDIYDQQEVLAKLKPNLSEEQINHALEEELFRRKEHELNKNCLEKIKKNIHFLEMEYDEAFKGQFRKNLIDTLKGAATTAPLAGMLFGSGSGPLGSLAGLAIGTLAGTVASLANIVLEDRINNDRKKRADPPSIIQEMRELSIEMSNLKEGLKTESVMPLEKEYIRKKRKIADSKLQTEIEKALLQARKSDFLADLSTQFIGLSLGLPVSPKPLFNPKDPDSSREELIRKFRESLFFSSFNEVVRNKLRNLITQTAVDSQEIPSSQGPLRRAYYFYGDPSCGKTSAAREVPRLLGVPYVEMSIFSAAELSRDSLEGSGRLRSDVNVGWLVKPLLEKTEGDGRTYLNGFLIINDLDRVLASGDSNQAISTLSFLLYYLDSGTQKFYSPYFNTSINVKYLNIIITANKKMENNHFYEALRTRITDHIEFSRFSNEKTEEIMKLRLEEVVGHHYPPNFLNFTYLDPTQIQISYDSKKLSHYAIDDMTYLKPQSIPTGISKEDKDTVALRILHNNQLDMTINNYLNNILEERRKNFDDGKQLVKNQDEEKRNEGIHNIKLAALKGHHKALHILKQFKEQSLTLEIFSHKQIAKGEKESSVQKQISARKVAEFYAGKDESKMKKWYGKSIRVGEPTIAEMCCAYYLQNKGEKLKNITDEDRELLSSFEAYPQSQGNSNAIEISLNTIGDTLAASHFLDFETAYKCYASALHLGCQVRASEGLYNLGEKFERKEGLGCSGAKKCYLEAAGKAHGMSQFKLGWLAWKEMDFSEAFEWAFVSKNKSSGWGHWLVGILYENNLNLQTEDAQPSINLQKALEQYKEAYTHEELKPFATHRILSLYHKHGIKDQHIDIHQLDNEVLDYVKPLKNQLNQYFPEESAFFLREAFQKSGLKESFFGVDLEYFDLIGKMYEMGLYSSYFHWNPKKIGKVWFERAAKLKGESLNQRIAKNDKKIVISDGEENIEFIDIDVLANK